MNEKATGVFMSMKNKTEGRLVALYYSYHRILNKILGTEEDPPVEISGEMYRLTFDGKKKRHCKMLWT